MTFRLQKWEDRLSAAVAEYRHQPWVWGETDCACFAAACVEAITGYDVMGTLRGSYNNRLGASARILGRGRTRLHEIAGDRLAAIGAIKVDPLLAGIGDIGCTDDDYLAVRLSQGFMARMIVGQPPTGVLLRARNVSMAWHLPY